MNAQKIFRTIGNVLLFVFLFFIACDKQEEVVALTKVLPEEMMAEINKSYPELKVTLVAAQSDANVAPKFNNKFMHISGIINHQERQKMAYIILHYLENSNEKDNDKERKEEYDKLQPKEKLVVFTTKVKEKYPDFNFEWVSLDKGNVIVKYGENTLSISGINDERTREEVAYSLVRIQKEIDKK